MEESPAQGVGNQDPCNAAYNLGQRKHLTFGASIEAKQITATLAILDYKKWEDFQSKKIASRVVAMKNSQGKEETREALTRRNGEGNEAPINTKELNDRVNMLVKAMDDLVFTSSSKNVRQDSSTPKGREEYGEGARRTHPLTRKPLEDHQQSKSNSTHRSVSIKSTRSRTSKSSKRETHNRSTDQHKSKKHKAKNQRRSGGTKNAKR